MNKHKKLQNLIHSQQLQPINYNNFSSQNNLFQLNSPISNIPFTLPDQEQQYCDNSDINSIINYNDFKNQERDQNSDDLNLSITQFNDVNFKQKNSLVKSQSVPFNIAVLKQRTVQSTTNKQNQVSSQHGQKKSNEKLKQQKKSNNKKQNNQYQKQIQDDKFNFQDFQEKIQNIQKLDRQQTEPTSFRQNLPQINQFQQKIIEMTNLIQVLNENNENLNCQVQELQFKQNGFISKIIQLQAQGTLQSQKIQQQQSLLKKKIKKIKKLQEKIKQLEFQNTQQQNFQNQQNILQNKNQIQQYYDQQETQRFNFQKQQQEEEIQFHDKQDNDTVKYWSPDYNSNQQQKINNLYSSQIFQNSQTPEKLQFSSQTHLNTNSNYKINEKYSNNFQGTNLFAENKFEDIVVEKNQIKKYNQNNIKPQQQPVQITAEFQELTVVTQIEDKKTTENSVNMNDFDILNKQQNFSFQKAINNQALQYNSNDSLFHQDTQYNISLLEDLNPEDSQTQKNIQNQNSISQLILDNPQENIKNQNQNNQQSQSLKQILSIGFEQYKQQVQEQQYQNNFSNNIQIYTKNKNQDSNYNQIFKNQQNNDNKFPLLEKANQLVQQQQKNEQNKQLFEVCLKLKDYIEVLYLQISDQKEDINYYGKELENQKNTILNLEKKNNSNLILKDSYFYNLNENSSQSYNREQLNFNESDNEIYCENNKENQELNCYKNKIIDKNTTIMVCDSKSTCSGSANKDFFILDKIFQSASKNSFKVTSSIQNQQQK